MAFAVPTSLLGAEAEAATVALDYGVWLAGLPIGSAEMTTAFEGDSYQVQVQARLTGLAGVLTGGKGGGTANGSLAGAKLAPARFAVATRSSSAYVTIRMAIASGRVSAVDIDPPPEPKPDRVPLTEAHKRGVLDPASALLMPVLGRGDPADPVNCNRTIPVFDGWTRFDIALSFAEARLVDQAGYKGPALVCNARYVPIAGHRAERPATRFMEENRDMSVWLVPVEGSRTLVPFRISVRTMLGTNVIEATRWSLDKGKIVPTASAGRSR